MRHPVVCVGAKAVVNMHRPQRQRGILFPQQHQLMQKNRRVQTAAEGHQQLAMGMKRMRNISRHIHEHTESDGPARYRARAALARFTADIFPAAGRPDR